MIIIIIIIIVNALSYTTSKMQKLLSFVLWMHSSNIFHAVK